MRRVMLVGLVMLVATACVQAAEGWRVVLEEGFDAGTLDPAQWGVFPDPAALPAFDARGAGKAVHLYSPRGDRGIGTRAKAGPPYRLQFDFLQPGTEATGYRLVVNDARRDGNAWWFEFDKGAFSVWTTSGGGWAPRWTEAGLTVDTWYRVTVDEEPTRVRFVIADEGGKTLLESGWLAHDDLGLSGGIAFIAATGDSPRGAVLDNVKLEAPRSAPEHRTNSALDPALGAAVRARVAEPGKWRSRVTTTDGLELTLDADAGVRGLKVDGASVLGGKARGGFYAWDITEDTAYERFSAAPGGATGEPLKLRCEKLGLGLEARFEGQDGKLEVTGDLADLRGEDRAIVLVYVLPLAADGWEWGDSLEDSRAIAEPGLYQSNQTYGAGGPRGRHLLATFPWGSVTNARRGLMVARPMDWPRLMGYSYNHTPGAGYLAVRVELGLSPLTRKFPGRASFRFSLSRVPRPEWGMRAAAQRYYDLYPEFFVKRAKTEGLWHLWVTTDTTDPEELGMVFHEQEPYYWDRVAYDDAHGGYSFTYSEPNTLWQHSTDYNEEGRFQPAGFLTRALERTKLPEEVTEGYPLWSQPKPLPDAYYAKVLLNSYLGREGEPAVYPAPPDRVAVDCNGDPELPEPNRASLWFDYEGIPALTDPRVDGAYLDSVGWCAFDAVESFRKEQWATADLPLIPSFQASAPAQLAQFAHYELYEAIAKAMWERGKMMQANTFPFSHILNAHLIDAVGVGEAGSLEPFHETYKLSFCRALCYRKPLSHMNYAYFHPDVPLAEKERGIQRNLVYGVWPGSGNGATAAQMDLVRPLYRKYVPILGALAAAGWEPITLARAQPERVVVERYGDPSRGTVLVAAHNPSTEPAQVTLRLDTALTGGARSLRARELVGGGSVRFVDGQAELALGPWETVVLRVAR